MSATSEPTTHQPAESRPAEAPSASPVDAHTAPVTETRERSGKATTAMVLGIVGLLAGLVIPILGVILGIIAVVYGKQAKEEVAGGRKSGRGAAQAGFVLGIVAIAVSVVNWIVTVAIVAS